jgi:glycopeptide antibiotics resistance protein
MPSSPAAVTTPETSAASAHDERDIARGRMLAIVWTVCYAGLIVVVSLIPSHIDLSHEHIAGRLHMFTASLRESPRLHSLRDLATNFVLYVPLGVLLPMTQKPRSIWRVPGIFVGLLLSIAMESAQVATTRFPSIWDIAMNAAGYAAGYLVVARVLAGRGLTAAIFVGRRVGTARQQLATGLRQVYVPLLSLMALLPLNITVRVSDLWAKLHGTLGQGGRIWLDPLGPWPGDRVSGLFTAVLLLMPYGFLSYVAKPQRGRRAYVRYALLGALISALIETMQLVVRSRTSDLVQVLCAGLGAALGVGMARAWDRSPSAQEAAETHAFEWRDGLLFALCGYAILLLVLAWRPFTFVASFHEAWSRLVHDTAWIPLRAYMSGERSLAIWRDLLREAGWYVPLGMLLQAYLGRVSLPSWFPPRAFVALLVIGVLGTVLELGQSLIVGRLADSTDIISHLMGGLCGYLVLSALRRGRATDPAA